MRKRFALLLFWLVCSLGAWAQPSFLAYNEQNQPVTTFCVGERIRFKDNTPRSADPNFTEFYDFNGKDNQEKFEGTSHIFTVPGEVVVVQLAYGFDQRPITFTVKAQAPATPPQIQRLSFIPNSVQIQVNSTAVNDLILERAASPGGAFSPIDTIKNVPVGSSLQTLKTTITTGCFRLRVTNSCTNATIVSSPVCAQDLQVTAGDRRNQLSWTPNGSPGPITGYQLLRGGEPFQTLPASQTSFTDAQVACGRKYSYQLVALLPNGGQTASLPLEVETKGTTPPAAPLLLVSFDLQNKVKLDNVVPAQETFLKQTVFRSQNGGAFSPILENQPKTTVDASLSSLPVSLCYQVAYTDSCRLVSPRSASACPALLTATLQPNGGVELTWKPYEGFPTGVGSQRLELLDEQGTVYWSLPVTGHTYLDAQPQEKYQRLTYRLVSTAQNAPYESFSNTATVDQGFQFRFPTAFTPNQDGLNDVFRPVGAPFASRFTLQVLNRWGQILFESKDPKAGWDGTHGGKPAPPETYLYRMEAVDVNGQKITQKGTVTLIR
ncbi:T9SS type B sorting domain-containing protein [Rufibacter glacialis]|uniref:Gliding motility-associated C-terminal domain-containing protein n=1 Tax=Rufibacter glacialis TaxID=1259555 RepID=A0A5M8QF14_9BACT|nr:gliding motility-associated C-terminal domain-containing protein [Rufibacter glacialis]KAA6434599.1 gliding motility-associated C-terminal domain-containing protein [Rufibacter glacialis]GGK70855.1 hypothetical protein GCM10011405_18830 [Rufibacter glacialis]